MSCWLARVRGPRLLTDIDLQGYSLEDVAAAARHLEDLDVFVGQRSRLHPGPGWELALRLVRRDLALAQAELASRAAAGRPDP